MKLLKRAFIFFNLHALIVTLLSVGSTYLSLRYELLAEFPLTLITTAVVFPIVFSIGAAYNRREYALNQYGSLKAHGQSIYFAARDWLDERDEELLLRLRDLLGGILSETHQMLSCRDASKLPENEEKVFTLFSRLSLLIKEDLRGRGLAAPEVSRCNQYLSEMLEAVEDMKHIYQYRTTRTLSTFSDIFVTVLPIIYGPYFAALSKDYAASLTYVMPVLLTLTLISLNNMQRHLENPYDQIGQDDIRINADKFVRRLEFE